MRHLLRTNGLCAGLCGLLLLTTEGFMVTAQAAKTTSGFTPAQVTACIQAAVTAQPGLVTAVEAEHEKEQQLCEVKIVAEDGKKYKLHVDVNTNQVIKTK
jgi:uncharacterized membrane protein YkoI